jgi:hypothetical protein
VEDVGSKEHPLIQIRFSINSALLQTARRLKKGLQRGTRQIMESIAEKTKEIW